MILREVCNILNGGQDYCRERGEQRNDDVVKKPRFSTDRVVVEAVDRYGCSYVVNEEKPHIRKRQPHLVLFKSLYRKRPQTEVRVKEIIYNKNTAVSDNNNN